MNPRVFIGFDVNKMILPPESRVQLVRTALSGDEAKELIEMTLLTGQCFSCNSETVEVVSTQFKCKTKLLSRIAFLKGTDIYLQISRTDNGEFMRYQFR